MSAGGLVIDIKESGQVADRNYVAVDPPFVALLTGDRRTPAMVATTHKTDKSSNARFEYRVWGKHREARQMLRKLASSETSERVDDCYLLVEDSSWNAKIRDNTLKIKRLIAEDKGFERWSSGKHRSSESAPSPFDDLFDELHLDRPQRGKSYDLLKAVTRLSPESGIRAVFVVKNRRRYRIGQLRAEATDVRIKGTKEVLRTLSIEGDDLDELVALRKKLGLKGEPNNPVHQAIDPEES